MRLTRRDALAALSAAGVAGGVAGGALLASDRDGETEERAGPIDEPTVETLVAAAAVLYPSSVDGVEAFVRRYVRGRAADRPEHAAAVAEAAAYLDAYAESWHDTRFAGLPAETRDESLREMGADAADPVPDGSDVERVRYYVVDELLFALYASPTGGELVGLENPQGYPGGVESYRRGPEA